MDAAEFVVADDVSVYLGSREALRSRRLCEFDNLVLIAPRSGPSLAGDNVISLLIAASNGGGEYGGGGVSASGFVADGYRSGMKVNRAGSPSTFCSHRRTRPLLGVRTVLDGTCRMVAASPARSKALVGDTSPDGATEGADVLAGRKPPICGSCAQHGTATLSKSGF